MRVPRATVRGLMTVVIVVALYLAQWVFFERQVRRWQEQSVRMVEFSQMQIASRKQAEAKASVANAEASRLRAALATDAQERSATALDSFRRENEELRARVRELESVLKLRDAQTKQASDS